MTHMDNPEILGTELDPGLVAEVESRFATPLGTMSPEPDIETAIRRGFAVRPLPFSAKDETAGLNPDVLVDPAQEASNKERRGYRGDTPVRRTLSRM